MRETEWVGGDTQADGSVYSTAEISLYVHQDYRGQQTGDRLLAQIIEEAKKQGDRFHVIIGEDATYVSVCPS